MSKRPRDEETPQLPSQEITTIVTEIYQAKGSQKEKQRIFRKKYTEFAENYPVLFEMATREDFELAKFKYMMHMRDSINNQSISQYDASAKVGTMLYNDYVKPLVDKK
jgi:hypothetical protein